MNSHLDSAVGKGDLLFAFFHCAFISWCCQKKDKIDLFISVELSEGSRTNKIEDSVSGI